MDPSTKIYLDCTSTYHSGLNTGIQRVVRNIVKRKELYDQTYNSQTITIISFLNNYYFIKPELVLNSRPVTASLGAQIKSSFDHAKRACLKKTSFNKTFQYSTNKLLDGIEFLLKKCFSLIKFLRTLKTVISCGMKKVNFNSTDILIILDAFWTYNLKKSLQNQNRPRLIASIIYDLIPIHFPQYVEDFVKVHFTKSLSTLIKNADIFICISDSVRNEMINYIGNRFHNLRKKKKVFHFNLGSDIKSTDTDTNAQFSQNSFNRPIRPDLVYLFKNKKIWITVGTIEPRKNHQFILDNFDSLWSEGHSDILLIIGRVGWKCEDVIKRIEKHPELNKKLFFKSDITDSELNFCYKNSVGLIFASYTEGFGLPIVEAMAANLKVYCSDIPVFREVGVNYPTYFSLNQKHSLKKAIIENHLKTNREKPHWIDWDESAQEFISIVMKSADCDPKM